MSTLHFYSPHGDIQLAQDDAGAHYYIRRVGAGLHGIVFSTDTLPNPREVTVLLRLDWSDHAVHVDEMKRAFQEFADTRHQASDAATVGV